MQNINKTLSPGKYNKFEICSVVYICLVNILYVFQFQYEDIVIHTNFDIRREI